MLKKLLIPMLVMLVLSGCNLPAAQQTGTANPTDVQAIVSGSLTAQAATQADLSTQTAASATSTQPVATETSTPTNTEPAVVLTETPTITVVPNGFRQTLGDPDWINRLDDGSAFGLDETGYQDDNTRIYMKDGAMVLSSSSTYGYRGWRLTTSSPTNVYLEAKFDVINCESADLYGVVYRAPDYATGQGYYLGVTCDGKFNVTKWTDSGSSTIISSMPDDSIRSGAGQTNRLGIQMVQNDFYIHINDVLVTQFTDDSFEDGGHIGVFIAGQGNGNLVVNLDEIAYWVLE